MLVEGAGGLLVRFADGRLDARRPGRALDAPTLVVAAAGLGTLNHTALTLEALARRGVELRGRRHRLLAARTRTWPPRCNLADLETIAGRPLAGALPDGAGAATPATSSPLARAGLAPALGGSFDAADFRARQPLPTRR